MANGQLDTRTLAQIDGEPGDLLRADACGYWNALQRDFRKAMGYGLGVREAYRPLSVQIGYFVTRYAKTSRNTGLWYDGTYWAKKAGVPAAARPGTSKHGDGLAVDATIDSFTSPAYRWMAANAGRYGFGNNQGRADGEPWHWVFGETRPSTQPAGVGATPIDNEEHNLNDGDREWMNKFGDALIQQVRAGVLADTLRELPGRILDTPVARAGETNDDGTPKYTAWRDWVGYTQKFVDYLAGKAERPDLDEAELGEAIAAKLAPIVAASVGKLTDAEVDALATAVVDEQARRLKA